MTDLEIDVQYSIAYHPSGNGLAEQAFSGLNLAIKRNGLGVGKQHLQDWISSLNNQSSSGTGVGTASERLLGFWPRFDLPLVSKYMTPSQRVELLSSLRANRDKGVQKKEM